MRALLLVLAFAAIAYLGFRDLQASGFDLAVLPAILMPLTMLGVTFLVLTVPAARGFVLTHARAIRRCGFGLMALAVVWVVLAYNGGRSDQGAAIFTQLLVAGIFTSLFPFAIGRMARR